MKARFALGTVAGIVLFLVALFFLFLILFATSACASPVAPSAFSPQQRGVPLAISWTPRPVPCAETDVAFLDAGIVQVTNRATCKNAYTFVAFDWRGEFDQTPLVQTTRVLHPNDSQTFTIDLSAFCGKTIETDLVLLPARDRLYSLSELRNSTYWAAGRLWTMPACAPIVNPPPPTCTPINQWHCS